MKIRTVYGDGFLLKEQFFNGHRVIELAKAFKILNHRPRKASTTGLLLRCSTQLQVVHLDTEFTLLFATTCSSQSSKSNILYTPERSSTLARVPSALNHAIAIALSPLLFK